VVERTMRIERITDGDELGRVYRQSIDGRINPAVGHRRDRLAPRTAEAPASPSGSLPSSPAAALRYKRHSTVSRIERGVRTEDRQALLTTLTTEHFTLQGARSQTVGESAHARRCTCSASTR
jgi:hypothetical protein